MALITCPECGKEISDKVKACIHCGYPITVEENVTRIQTPSFKQALSTIMKERECGILDENTNEVLWRGRVGSIAELKIDKPVSIKVHFYWLCFPKEIKLGTISPGKTYRFHEGALGWRILEVENII